MTAGEPQGCTRKAIVKRDWVRFLEETSSVNRKLVFSFIWPLALLNLRSVFGQERNGVLVSDVTVVVLGMPLRAT